jgi:hypothetical protein
VNHDVELVYISMDNAVGVQLRKTTLAIVVVIRSSNPALELLTRKANYLLVSQKQAVKRGMR